MIAVCSCFCGPGGGGGVNGSCGGYWSFLAWGWSFPGSVCVSVCVCVFVGLEAVSKVESSVRVHTSSSEVYPAGKLQ